MKNRRRKRKQTTPQRPVISEAIDTVTPPFIHNQLCITLPEAVFRNLEHYGRFISGRIKKEDLPAHYGTLIQPTDDPGKVTLCVKSDPHSLAEQLCFYSHNPHAVKNLDDIPRRNAVAELIPETSTAFSKENINTPEVQTLDILTIDQLQRLWKKLIISTAGIVKRTTEELICFKGDMAFSPLPPELSSISQNIDTIRLAYYYCADPTLPYERFQVSEFIEMTSFCFIFFPHDTNTAEIITVGLQGEGHACFWSINHEKDMEKIVEMWKEKTLTRSRWKAMGAKRLVFKPMQEYKKDENGIKYKDWITRTWITEEESNHTFLIPKPHTTPGD